MANTDFFYSHFDSSFEGHNLTYVCDYYEGRAWHTTYGFTVNGVRLEMDSYYSQAYIPFDKRDDEISTVSIRNKKYPGLCVSKQVSKFDLLTYKELEILVQTEEPTVGGFKYNDRVRTTYNGVETGTVVALFPQNNRVRVKLDGSTWSPVMKDFMPGILELIPKYAVQVHYIADGATDPIELEADSEEMAQKAANKKFSEIISRAKDELQKEPTRFKTVLHILNNISVQ